MTVPVCVLRPFSVLLETLTWGQPCSNVRWWASDSWDCCLKSECSAVWMCYKIVGGGALGLIHTIEISCLACEWMSSWGGGDRSGERIACLGHVRIIMLRFFLWWGWCFSWKNRLHGTWKTLLVLVVYTGCSRFALCIHEIAISPPTLVFAGVTCLRFQHLLIRMIVTHFSRALLTSVCSGRGRSAAKTVLHAGCDG